MNNEVHRLGKKCPSCGYSIDGHSNLSDPDALPSPNDISICFNCGAWNKYGEDLEIISFTDEDKENTAPELLPVMEQISDRIKKQYYKKN